MLKKILKNKKAQSTLEFCLAVPVVLLLTLGAVDVAKANIVKLENTQAMQAYLSKVAADSDPNGERGSAAIKRAAGNYIQQTSMFCTKVDGASGNVQCKGGTEPVKTTLRLERASKSPRMNAGVQICMAAKSEYKPFYSGVYSGGKMVVYSRACTLMETNKDSDGGWQPLATGRW